MWEELEILRKAVELAEEKAGRIQVNSPQVKKIIEIAVFREIRKMKKTLWGPRSEK